MTPERAHVYWNGTFSEAEKAALVRTELPPALDRILGELRDRSPRQAMIWRRFSGSIRDIFFPTIF